MVSDEQVKVGCFLNREALMFVSYQTKISAFKLMNRELLDYVSEANVVAVSDSWVYKRVSLVVWFVFVICFVLVSGRAVRFSTESQFWFSPAAKPLCSLVIV